MITNHKYLIVKFGFFSHDNLILQQIKPYFVIIINDNYLIVRIVEDGNDDTLAHADGDDLDDGTDLAI